uniref:Putative c2h2-type zn-finger protein n=1 Tax=Panstrongylus megistus TaxID=65343 RepID=A0A069DTG3_9HEMI
MSYNYTCISCRVAFSDADIQRQHYKTDWHRYNLKRKVVNLPPVTSEDFQQRVLQQREKDALQTQDTSVFCKVCRKSFGSAPAFENHLNSKRHKESLINFTSDSIISVESISEPLIQSRKENKDTSDNDKDDDSDIEEIDSDEWEEDEEEVSENNPILKNNCLFCNHHSATITKNLKHMSIDHSFFIPDIEYIVDIKGLLLYLGEKVCKFYMCLWCNWRGREFHSMEAAQTHMKDKGHCKMLHEGAALAEYESFYNYSQSYPDHNEEMDVDQEVTIPALDDDDFQLTLPSGATIGHRMLLRYYKQHFSPNQVATTKTKINKVLSSYRALGWTSTDKIAAERKAKDIKYMKMVQNKYFMQLGVKSNKLQKYFRPQVNF